MEDAGPAGVVLIGAIDSRRTGGRDGATMRLEIAVDLVLGVISVVTEEEGMTGKSALGLLPVVVVGNSTGRMPEAGDFLCCCWSRARADSRNIGAVYDRCESGLPSRNPAPSTFSACCGDGQTAAAVGGECAELRAGISAGDAATANLAAWAGSIRVLVLGLTDFPPSALLPLSASAEDEDERAGSGSGACACAGQEAVGPLKEASTFDRAESFPSREGDGGRLVSRVPSRTALTSFRFPFPAGEVEVDADADVCPWALRAAVKVLVEANGENACCAEERERGPSIPFRFPLPPLLCVLMLVALDWTRSCEEDEEMNEPEEGDVDGAEVEVDWDEDWMFEERAGGMRCPSVLVRSGSGGGVGDDGAVPRVAVMSGREFD